jgi:hypothetical protein
MQMTRMVDFDDSFFTWYFFLEQCINEWCKGTTATKYNEQAQYDQDDNDRRQPEFLTLFQKEP